MRSVVGPLLFGLAPLLAMGCALTPDRSFSRTEGFGFHKNRSSSARISNEPNSSKELTFKTPKQKRGSSLETADPFGQGGGEEIKRTNHVADTNAGDGDNLIPGHSTDSQSSKELKTASSITETSTGTQSPGTQSRNFSANSESNPIQLQGVEFEGTEVASVQSRGRPQNWDDEPTGSVDKNFGSSNPSETAENTPVLPWSERLANRKRGSAINERPPELTTGSYPKPENSKGPLTETPPSNPTGMLPMLPWRADLDRLIAIVERDLSETKTGRSEEAQDQYLRKQAHLRLLYLMAQRQEEALTAIPGVEPSQQEYWQQLIWAMSNSFDTVQFPDSADRAAQTMIPLSSALRQVREQATLSIKNMTFCRKISYFGNYERFKRNEFTPGYEVLLYTEIENFTTAPTVDGEYRTSLKSLIEIADSKGKIVWTKGFAPTEDFCRNPRRDYFHNYQFHIPEDLSSGAYTLKLTIVDEISKKRASNSLNFSLK